MQNFQHRVSDILKMPKKEANLTLATQETSDHKCAHLSVPAFFIDIKANTSAVEEPFNEYNMYQTHQDNEARPNIFLDRAHTYSMRSVNISPIRPIGAANIQIQDGPSNWTTTDAVDAAVNFRPHKSKQNYRIETQSNYLHQDK
jgi:hypothetical protein